jgi:hypothetical protein
MMPLLKSKRRFRLGGIVTKALLFVLFFTTLASAVAQTHSDFTRGWTSSGAKSQNSPFKAEYDAVNGEYICQIAVHRFNQGITIHVRLMKHGTLDGGQVTHIVWDKENNKVIVQSYHTKLVAGLETEVSSNPDQEDLFAIYFADFATHLPPEVKAMFFGQYGLRVER